MFQFGKMYLLRRPVQNLEDLQLSQMEFNEWQAVQHPLPSIPTTGWEKEKSRVQMLGEVVLQLGLQWPADFSSTTNPGPQKYARWAGMLCRPECHAALLLA